jgi:hypothetical protein
LLTVLQAVLLALAVMA